MSDDYKADVFYAGDDFFIGKSPSGHSQILDVSHDRNSAATPLELLLIALGSCTAVAVVSILKKKRQDVTGYRVEVRGTRREEHPRAFTKMEVKHIVHGRNVSPEAVARAIELSETKYCSVAETLRPTVEIVSSFEIIEDPGNASQQ
jgi:putative redox protein